MRINQCKRSLLFFNAVILAPVNFVGRTQLYISMLGECSETWDKAWVHEKGNFVPWDYMFVWKMSIKRRLIKQFKRTRSFGRQKLSLCLPNLPVKLFFSSFDLFKKCEHFNIIMLNKEKKKMLLVTTSLE